MSGELVTFYNMTMVCDAAGRVLVQDRLKSDWPGLTFPGGHTEAGESFTASAVREVREETGLTVRNLVPCGVVHWAHRESGRRSVEFLYRTSDFEGELLVETEEGRIFWMEREALRRSDCLSPNFGLYLPLFLDGNISELFFEWDGVSWNGVPQYHAYREMIV